MRQNYHYTHKSFRNYKTARRSFGALYVRATFVRWHRIYLLYKALINLQRKVCVTLASSGNGKKCTTELTFSFWKVYEGKLKQTENRPKSTLFIFLRKNFVETIAIGSHQRKGQLLFVSQYQKIVQEVNFVIVKVSGVSESFCCCPFVGWNNFGVP